MQGGGLALSRTMLEGDHHGPLLGRCCPLLVLKAGAGPSPVQMF